MNELKTKLTQARAEELKKIMSDWLAANPQFYPSEFHLLCLHDAMSYDSAPLTAEKLTKFYVKLTNWHAIDFSKAAHDTRVRRESEKAAAQSAEVKRTEQQRIWNLPENVAAREAAAAAEEQRREEEYLRSLWTPREGENHFQTRERALHEREQFFRRKFNINPGRYTIVNTRTKF